jgi:hypothetical protein
VDTDGETGMTGLALDPDFINNRFIYLLYATPSDQRISRITIATNFTSMVPGSEFILLSGLAQPQRDSQGGRSGISSARSV